MILEHKEGIVQAMGRDEEVMRMQLELWARFCMICRVQDGAQRKHDWRNCPWNKDEIDWVRGAIENIRNNRANWERAVAGKDKGCHGCAGPRTECWFWSEGDVRQIPREECEFRGVVLESAASILALGGERVTAWEDNRGRLRGDKRVWDKKEEERRVGHRAIGRMRRRFGWLGLIEIELYEVEEVGAEYRRRSMCATGREALA